MGWNIGGITVAGRRLKRHRRASRLLQPRHFLRRRKPLYWATAHPPSLGYYHTATACQTQCISFTHLDMTQATATVKMCSLIGWFEVDGRAVVEIFHCPSPAHTPPPEALSPSAPTAGWTSFLKPRVQPTMDLIQIWHRFFFSVFSVLHIHILYTNTVVNYENGFSWNRMFHTNTFISQTT